MWSLGRFLRTIRPLRREQLVGRVLYRLRSPSPVVVAEPPALRTASTRWLVERIGRASFSASGEPRFLNRVGSLDGPEAWNTPVEEKLWLYNLHYFDDLGAMDAERRAEFHAALVLRWIEENPIGNGVGWEPYPLSLRVVNWIKWALRFQNLEAAFHGSPDAITKFNRSLAEQGLWLEKRLEFHLLGNHLLANAKALLFLGAYFEGADAARWLEAGQRIAKRELEEQVLCDGGHFELSPMYHAIVLADLIDVLALANVFPAAMDDGLVRAIDCAVKRMAMWLRAMTHPDGEIAFFNDAAFGIAPNPSDLLRLAGADKLGQPSCEDGPKQPSLNSLSSSGYHRLEAGSAVLIADIAEIGPAYLPGHAHADTLSFELSLFGRRVIVNGGTSCYGTSARRVRERGTRAHSTVCIGGSDSSEVWSGFRVGRRAHASLTELPSQLSEFDSPTAVSIAGRHDGYRYLPGGPIHSRSWRLSRNQLRVLDHIFPLRQPAQARYILHPDVSLSLNGDFKAQLEIPGGGGAAVLTASVPLRLERVDWSPEFGTRIETNAIAIDFDGDSVALCLEWN